MRVRYDPEVDILYIRLSDAPIADSESVEPNLVLDRDAADDVVGIEVLGASRLPGAAPMTMAFEVVDAAAAARSASSGNEPAKVAAAERAWGSAALVSPSADSRAGRSPGGGP